AEVRRAQPAFPLRLLAALHADGAARDGRRRARPGPCHRRPAHAHRPEPAPVSGRERARRRAPRPSERGQGGRRDRRIFPSTVAEAVAESRELRRRLRDEAESRGYRVASAGTHPFSRWEHQDITEKPRYEELIEELRWTAERQLIFGLHVHVGLESAQQAIAVANALRT